MEEVRKVKKQKHLMLDIETLSESPKAVILALYACFFDTTSKEIGKEVLVHMNVANQIESGREISSNTLKWWIEKDSKLMLDLMGKGNQNALFSFDDLKILLQEAFEVDDDTEIIAWSRGKSFDFSLLNDAIPSHKVWKFYHQLDIRTLDLCFPHIRKRIKKPENQHHPEVDCRYQIEYLVEIFKEFNIFQYNND